MSMVLRPDEDGLLDIAWDGGLVDNPAGADFVTAVSVSLFSDARAEEGSGLPLYERRGYAADPTLGSRIWRAFQEPLTQAALVTMRGSVEASLAWMVESGIGDEVVVTVTRIDRAAVKLAVEIRRGDEVVWSSAWRVTDDEVAKINAV